MTKCYCRVFVLLFYAVLSALLLSTFLAARDCDNMVQHNTISARYT